MARLYRPLSPPLRPRSIGDRHGLFRIQVSHAALYRWLVARGITPRKSLTLGAIDVPDEHLAHFVRGLFDGDRSIYVRLQRPTLRRYPNYRYVRLWTYFSTASWSHVRWLHGRLRGWLGITGWIEERERLSGNMLYRLRFGKGDSIVLLRAIYADPSWPALNRKRQTWSTYERETFGAEGGT